MSPVFPPYHLHSMVVDELLRGHAVDLVHKALLVGEEVVEVVGEASTQRDAALVALIQTFHHWEKREKWVSLF